MAKQIQKVKRLVTHTSNIEIVETISQNNIPTFVQCDLKTKKVNYLESVEIAWEQYSPLKSTNSFLKTGALKLPTNLDEYIDKEEILKEIRIYIYKYVDCSDEFLTMCSYYVFLSYFYRAFEEIPYLRVIWDYGSGKSRLLKTVWNICYSPTFMNGSASLASIFRVMEMVKGTFIFDEADLAKSDTSNDLIKIFNNGYQKWMPVFRAEWDDFDPRAFDVYSPKIIGGRMEFTDKATESRCLSEIMKSTKRTDIGELDQEFENSALKIRNKLLKYKLDNYASFVPNLNKYELKWLEPRLKQVLRPILSVIDDESEANIIIDYMRNRQEDMIKDRQLSLEWYLFEILGKYISNSRADKIHLKELCNLISDDFKYITSRKIWSLLRQHGINTFNRDSIGMYLDLVKSKSSIEEMVSKYWLEEKTKKTEVVEEKFENSKHNSHREEKKILDDKTRTKKK